MTKILIFKTIIILFVFVGCTTKKESTSFDYIDLTYEAWEPYSKYKLKIFNNGKTNISRTEYLSEAKYYSLTLNKVQLDSVNHMVNELYKSSLDSLYDSPCDAIVLKFCLIVKSKYRKNRIFYDGAQPLDLNKHYALYHFVEYLNEIPKKANVETDSIYVFESNLKQLKINYIEAEFISTTDSLKIK